MGQWESTDDLLVARELPELTRTGIFLRPDGSRSVSLAVGVGQEQLVLANRLVAFFREASLGAVVGDDTARSRSPLASSRQR